MTKKNHLSREAYTELPTNHIRNTSSKNEDIAFYKRVRQPRAIHTPLADDVLQAHPSSPSGIRDHLLPFRLSSAV
jgi:hypothetical protein